MFKNKIIIIFSALLFVSCELFRETAILKEFTGSEIVMTDSIDCYIAGKDTTIDIMNIYEQKLIIYYDSIECSTC